MTAKSLADRVAALEAKMGSRTIEEQFREQAELIDLRFSAGFREQAELIDRLFACRFEELDKKWDAKLDVKLGRLENSLESRLERKLEATLETKLESKLKPIQNDLAAVKDAVKMILARLT